MFRKLHKRNSINRTQNYSEKNGKKMKKKTEKTFFSFCLSSHWCVLGYNSWVKTNFKKKLFYNKKCKLTKNYISRKKNYSKY